MSVTCPKCGFEQEGGGECLRCGIIFSKYVPPLESALEAAPPVQSDEPEAEENVGPGPIRRFYRVFRWVVLAVSLYGLFLILSPAAAPVIDSDPEAGQRVEAKVRRLERAIQLGRPHTLELNEAELNVWLQANLALAENQRAVEADRVRRRAADVVTGGAISKIAPERRTQTLPDVNQAIAEVQSSVHDIKIHLMGDSLQAYLLFDLYGKEMSLQLEGKLTVQNGYLRLVPTAGKLGRLPIPQVTLDNAVRRLFDSPENREKFRVPPHIRDIRIENGELKVAYR